MLRRWFGHTTMADVDRQLPQSLRRRRRRTVVVIANNPQQVTRIQINKSRWERARALAAAWAPWRSYASQHLWQAPERVGEHRDGMIRA